jgi:hypothetical protein
MSRRPVRLGADLTVAQAAEALGDSDAFAGVLADHDGAPSFVRRDELVLALEAGRGGSPVRHVASEAEVHVHPDQGFDVVVERYWQSRGVLPVLSRDNIADVVGLITERDMTRFVSRPAGPGSGGKRITPR